MTFPLLGFLRFCAALCQFCMKLRQHRGFPHIVRSALCNAACIVHRLARRLDDGYTLEVNRLCTNGTPNACSILYAAVYRAARAMGYTKVVTYILDTESGVSLKAAGYVCEGRAGGLEWNGERKPKMANQYPYQMKTRWVKKIEKEGMNGR